MTNESSRDRLWRKGIMKTWRKPKISEISVGTEINAYACAGL